LAALRIDLVGTTADFRRFRPPQPLPINHLLSENRGTQGRIGEVRLRTIEAGTTLSYRALARQLGRPKSVRAVGSANGANPVAIVVPCHRVIGADGSLTGYGGGISRKRWLLTHEGVALEQFATRRIPEAA
jgi:methylated-DNA-[protein]-cysteine S-methyltransferase